MIHFPMRVLRSESQRGESGGLSGVEGLTLLFEEIEWRVAVVAIERCQLCEEAYRFVAILLQLFGVVSCLCDLLRCPRCPRRTPPPIRGAHDRIVWSVRKLKDQLMSKKPLK